MSVTVKTVAAHYLAAFSERGIEPLFVNARGSFARFVQACERCDVSAAHSPALTFTGHRVVARLAQVGRHFPSRQRRFPRHQNRTNQHDRADWELSWCVVPVSHPG